MSTKSYQDQYREILERLINDPHKKVMNRNGETLSRFSETIRVDLSKEFPLMEVKHVSIKNIIHELLWMISGNTNIKYLVDNNCNIWNDDAYNYHKKQYGESPINKKDFVQKIKNGEQYQDTSHKYGDLDRVYGYQWRRFNGQTDQLQNAINFLQKDPNNRRIIVTAHNPSDIENEVVGLPSCHNLFQFYTIPTGDTYKLCTAINMRSNDFFLGQPYNVTQYALLTHMIAKLLNYEVGEIFFTLVDCHLYSQHLDAANQWLESYDEYSKTNNGDTFCKSKININKRDKIDEFIYENFSLSSYNSLRRINAPLLT